MVFTLKDIREIADETIMGVQFEHRFTLTAKTRQWANENVHKFIELEGNEVHFDRYGFESAVIDKAQDIAAVERYPLVADLF